MASIELLISCSRAVASSIVCLNNESSSLSAFRFCLSPTPLGILFALFTAFTATQVWSDKDKASSFVDREASALRAVVILAAAFPGEPETRLRNLIRSHVADAAAKEWPMMAHRAATLL